MLCENPVNLYSSNTIQNHYTCQDINWMLWTKDFDPMMMFGTWRRVGDRKDAYFVYDHFLSLLFSSNESTKRVHPCGDPLF